MIDRFERFSLAISEISRYWHKIAGDEMEKYGLKSSHAMYLTTMYHYKNGITATSLCELCSKDKSDVSRMMSIMEKKGLVKKEGANNYRAMLKLTDEGKKLAEKVRTLATLAVELAGKELSPKKREIFYESLSIITENLKIISKEGLPE